MVEAVFASLATAIDQYHRAGEKIPKRTGNAFANFNRAPYNVYAAKDGYVAIILVTEAQWQNLLRAMGREDLKDDPRFIKNDARVAHYAETEALVSGWTSVAHAGRNLRRDQQVQDPLRAGARSGGGDERSAHAWPRHAGGGGSL